MKQNEVEEERYRKQRIVIDRKQKRREDKGQEPGR